MIPLAPKLEGKTGIKTLKQVQYRGPVPAADSEHTHSSTMSIKKKK